ncbi:MAG TPA: hypothetical protein VFZ42_11015 [Chitinophagaceae bacterium]
MENKQVAASWGIVSLQAAISSSFLETPGGNLTGTTITLSYGYRF